MTSSLQVFYWGAAAGFSGGKQYYDSFSLNGCDYTVGDSVSLFPEDDAQPHFLGRLQSAYIDSSASDPHAITVSWYERRDNQEVVELGEIDVNPIGCISGKVFVVHCSSWVEAQSLAKNLDQEWFFCRTTGQEPSRGTDRRSTQQLDDADYSEEESMEHSRHVKQEAGTKRQRHSSGAGMAMLESGQRDELGSFPRGRNPPSYRSAPLKAAPGVLLGGRTCVQCNATHTPQWREGPAGPKTLCNACGVRYCRLQQRDNKKPHGSGAARRGNSVAAITSKQARTGKGRKDTGKSSAAWGSNEYAGDPSAVDLPTSRPVRQAALLSATRTAEYARTGVFPSLLGTQGGGEEEQRHTAAQAGDGGAEAWEQEEGMEIEEDLDEEVEDEEADEGGGDSCFATATAAAVRLTSGSEPASPEDSSPHTHPLRNGGNLQLQARTGNGSGRATGVNGGAQHGSTRASGSGDSPDAAFDSIDAMLLLAGGGRNAAADAALLESGTGSPLTACELQELMLLAALGGPLGDVSCAPSPASACTGRGSSWEGQSGLLSTESSQQHDEGFRLQLAAGADEHRLTGVAVAGDQAHGEDTQFSLSTRAEEFCLDFDVETYQSALAPFGDLKEALQEDAFEKLPGAGDSALTLTEKLTWTQPVGTVPAGPTNATISSLAAPSTQGAADLEVAPTPSLTTLTDTHLSNATQPSN